VDGLTLFTQARAAGLTVEAEGEKLVVTGPASAEALALALLAHKPEIMAILARDDPEVAWRVTVMCPQVPARGPIPRLYARRETPAHDATRCCGSCGDPLPEHRRYVCAPCQHAAWMVLSEMREGL
jgi:RecJ-like exonuclease